MITFQVAGMTCGGCARSVSNAVHRLDPSAKVEVDLAAKRVTIASSLDESAFARAITEAGYKVSQPPA